ncbi:Riboflavin biosynthesis protein RibF [bioreactor metagenome]|uniref:Riboflavin biosynthesis protein RibF n=1 Tax=bioreactor metagenome TaxID=1076179 RepID=A0A645EG85_9ZZZZ
MVHIVAGHDFHFGYKGEGNPRRLQEKCAQLGIGCDIVDRVELEGVTVSSTYIRNLIAQGEIELANHFLGHPHVLSDTVSHGKKLGSTLGFPTVNLHLPQGVLAPAFGVYCSKVTLDSGECFQAVTNVGVRPTVDDQRQLTVESFLLDFNGDLYGRAVRIEFYKFLREECKFSDIGALREQICNDVDRTKFFFNGA